MPHKEVMQLWVQALTSGEYTQGHGQLRKDDKLCCLGVLCDLHARCGYGEWNGDKYRGESMFLPAAVREWAGFLGDNPLIPIPEIPTGVRLSYLNDGEVDHPDYYGQTMSFRHIADLILEHWLGEKP